MEGRTLPFDVRFGLAYEAVRLTYERRDQYLSDDDLLDAADAWTIDAPYADDEDPSDRDRPDYDALVAALFAAVSQNYS